MTDHTALKEAAEAATRGEWKTFDFHRVETARRNVITGAPVDICTAEEGVDAAFIALANPSKILELLAENERLRSWHGQSVEGHALTTAELGEAQSENAALLAENEALREEVTSRCDQVDKLQQWIDEMNVAIGGLGINLQEDRLQAIASLREQLLAALPQTEGFEAVREALGRIAEFARRFDEVSNEDGESYEDDAFIDEIEWVEDDTQMRLPLMLGDLRKAGLARQALALPVDGWRPEVRAFADLMEAQLRKNDHKGGWKNDRPHALLKRLYDEAAELGHAMPYDDDFDPENVGWEAADVANFAMMIADVCGALPAPAPPAPGRGGEDG